MKEAGRDDTVFRSTMSIRPMQGICALCGEIHYFFRLTFIGNWQHKIEPIDKETFTAIIKEQALAKLN